MGIKLEQSADFDEVHSVFKKLKKSYLTPHLDPKQNDFTAANCFWTIAYKDGEPFGLGGVRMDDLTGDNVEKYWARHFERVYPGGVCDIAPPVKTTLRGRVCYVGDFYIAEGARGSTAFLETTTQVTHALINLKWRPDFTYAFLHHKAVIRGAAARYGFTRTIPYSKRFTDLDGVRADDEYCAVLPREDFAHSIQAEWRNSLQASHSRDRDTPIKAVGT